MSTYQVLPPLSPKLQELRQSEQTDEDLKVDIQILEDDRLALDQLIEAILSNKRLAWEIVFAWCNKNDHYLISKADYTS